MHDEKGEDEKILAVPVGDPRFDGMNDLSDLPGHWLREIENFFATYKLLEEKETELEGWEDAQAALRVIADARTRNEQTLRGSTEP
jgi:inorganic pyrophosphatase